MNHPNREQWISFIYAESSDEERIALDAHLNHCKECSGLVAEWRGTQHALDRWTIPKRSMRRASFSNLPILKWAAAAAILLGMGYLAGRASQPAIDVEALQAAIEPALRQELADQFNRSLQTQLFAQAETMSGLLNLLDERHTEAAISLKRDIDTIAFNTQAGFRRTENQFVQLVDATQPANLQPTDTQ